MFRFVWRSAYVWALLFAAAFAGRTALDWLLPPLTFETRSAVSTLLAAGILVSAGGWAVWRSGSVVAGTVAGLATSAIGAVVSIAGAAILLALWHDPRTMAAIQASGGLAEVFTLPFALVIPAALVATVAAPPALQSDACLRHNTTRSGPSGDATVHRQVAKTAML